MGAHTIERGGDHGGEEGEGFSSRKAGEERGGDGKGLLQRKTGRRDVRKRLKGSPAAVQNSLGGVCLVLSLWLLRG